MLAKEPAATTSKEQELPKREDWMDIRSLLPCVFKDKKTESSKTKNANKPDLLALGQSERELNPYWKNGGSGIPQESPTVSEPVIDIKWLKKSLRRAKEQAEIENRSLEEIAAERWGVSIEHCSETVNLQLKEKHEKEINTSIYLYKRN